MGMPGVRQTRIMQNKFPKKNGLMLHSKPWFGELYLHVDLFDGCYHHYFFMAS